MVDINGIHKQEQQSMTSLNIVTNISKSEGGELKKHRTNNLISNLVAPKHHKAHYVKHGDK